MNAQPHAIADALAHAGFADSVDAKEREGTGPHRTPPNGVLSVGEFPSILTQGDEAALTQAAERFRSLVDFQPGDDCWKWMGEINHRGYGRFEFHGKRTVAHRFAYELVNGRIPEGLQCGHLCHNRPCVRPDHLKAMTAKENIRQRDERMGRTPGSSKSSAERTRQYRARIKARRERDRIEAGEWVCI